MATHVYATARCAVVMALVLSIAPARAQSVSEGVTDLPRETPRSLKILLGTEAILHSADMITTGSALRLGGREANPLLAPFADRPVVLVAVSGAVNVLQAYTISRLSRRHPKLAKAWAVALIGLEGYAVAHNIRVARQLERAR